MYIQITTRCNMTCEHCCMRCTKIGEDMTLKTYRKAIELSKEFGDTICLGGGEPTLHKNFWEMLGLAIGESEMVWMATNGSITKTALALAKIAQKNVIGCALSLDPWHDPINPEVIKAFDKNGSNDGREIRNSFKIFEKMSSWRNPTDGGNEKYCICNDLFVKPNGDINLCGCFDSPKLGDVFKGLYDCDKYPNFNMGSCYKEI